MLDLKSLSIQMILSFVGLVLLTAVLAGLPAIWLLRNQLESQAWAQVEQGQQAAQALYAARQAEVASLALLTSQRPSLRELLQGDEAETLASYLQTLRAGAGLDALIVCDTHDKAMAAAYGEVSGQDDLCQTTSSGFLLRPQDDGAPHVWIAAAHDLLDDQLGQLGKVVVAEAVNDEFAARMRSQTGLEHSVFLDGQPVASSLARGQTANSDLRQEASEPSTPVRDVFTVSGRPYYALRLPIGPAADGQSRVEAEVALPVAGIVATQERLLRILGVSILLAVAISSVLAVLLARRISRPLASLASMAAGLSGSQPLDSREMPKPDDKATTPAPVPASASAASAAVTSSVREVALVAQALEMARTDLQRTLDELRQEKAWTDHLLGAIVEGIVTLDHNGAITFFSPGAERISGLFRDDVLGRSCDRVFKTVDAAVPFSALIPAPGRRSKIPIELEGGRQTILAVTGARLLPPQGGDARVALVFRDISEEEAVHRLLSHFLANISHEFRTPLSAVAASVELLMDQAADLSLAELRELLTSLHLGVLSLQKLVDNLLESASIEAGRFRVHPRAADLSEIIAEAARTMQPLLDKRDQHLTIDLPAAIPVVRADPRRTVQVLVNLLSNASKYGPDDAEIAIGAVPEDEWMRINVADCGPGIPAGQRADLFRRSRIAAPNAAASDTQVGFGLGLSVVKAIVEGHGGQVGVDDRDGGGSVFWFTLPRVE